MVGLLQAATSDDEEMTAPPEELEAVSRKAAARSRSGRLSPKPNCDARHQPSSCALIDCSALAHWTLECGQSNIAASAPLDLATVRHSVSGDMPAHSDGSAELTKSSLSDYAPLRAIGKVPVSNNNCYLATIVVMISLCEPLRSALQAPGTASSFLALLHELALKACSGQDLSKDEMSRLLCSYSILDRRVQVGRQCEADAVWSFIFSEAMAAAPTEMRNLMGIATSVELTCEACGRVSSRSERETCVVLPPTCDLRKLHDQQPWCTVLTEQDCACNVCEACLSIRESCVHAGCTTCRCERCSAKKKVTQRREARSWQRLGDLVMVKVGRYGLQNGQFDSRDTEIPWELDMLGSRYNLAAVQLFLGADNAGHYVVAEPDFSLLSASRRRWRLHDSGAKESASEEACSSTSHRVRTRAVLAMYQRASRSPRSGLGKPCHATSKKEATSAKSILRTESRVSFVSESKERIRGANYSEQEKSKIVRFLASNAGNPNVGSAPVS